MQLSDVFARKALGGSESVSSAHATRLPSASTALLVAIAYYVGAKVGFALTFQPHPVSTLWPPNAILLGALLLTPKRQWPFLLLAAFPAHLAVELGSGIPAPMVLSWFVSNCSEALIGAFAVRWLVPGPLMLDSLRQVTIFAIFGAFLSSFLSSFLDAAFVTLNGFGTGSYANVWRMRFFSNVLASLTIVPVIVTLANQALHQIRTAPFTRVLEGIALGGLLLLVCSVSFYGSGIRSSALPVLLYAPMPVLLWAAMRFGPGGISASLLCVTLIAISGAVHGRGPFGVGSPEQNARAIQSFLLVVSMPLMALAAVVCERGRAAQALLEAQCIAGLATAAGRVRIWAKELDSAGNYTGAIPSETFGTHLGQTPDWIDCIHPADGRAILETEAAVLEHLPKDGRTETQIAETEYRTMHPDGSTHWLLMRGTVLHRDNGTPYRIVRTSIDISDRKRAENALRQSEERMALAAFAADLGFWSWNLRTGRLWATDQCRVILGQPASVELTLQTYLDAIHPADRQAIRDAFESAVNERTPYYAEHRLLRPDGSLRWVRFRGRVEYDASGDTVGATGVITDITSLKVAELAAEEQRREVAHLGRVTMLGEFAGALAHELNQPLTAIMANARAAERLLKREPPPLDDLRDIVLDIIRDDQRAADVIRELRRMLAKDESPTEVLDIREVARSAISIARSDIVRRGVSVSELFLDDLPHVLGDRVQLQQVILNLVMNACDAMDLVTPDARRITLSGKRDSSGAVCLSISDSGKGIAEDAVGVIFEPFFTTKSRGLGLGLAICRSIVSQHGGRIVAVNNAVCGATFHVLLPAASQSEPVRAAVRVRAPASMPSSPVNASKVQYIAPLPTD